MGRLYLLCFVCTPAPLQLQCPSRRVTRRKGKIITHRQGRKHSHSRRLFIYKPRGVCCSLNPHGSPSSSTSLLPTHSRNNFDHSSTMVFGKNLRKMLSSTRDQDDTSDPPPPYTLPEEFIQAGIVEDDLAILRDYDTVIIVDDSGSMDPLWHQVRSPFLLALLDRTDR